MPLPDATAQTLFDFDPGVVKDPTRRYLVPNAEGYFYATHANASADTARLSVYDSNGDTLEAVTSDVDGIMQPFRAPLPIGYVRFGTFIQQVMSGQQIVDVVTAASTQYTSQAAAITALQAAIDAITSGGVVIPGGGTGGTGGGDTTADPAGYGDGGYGDGGYGY